MKPWYFWGCSERGSLHRRRNLSWAGLMFPVFLYFALNKMGNTCMCCFFIVSEQKSPNRKYNRLFKHLSKSMQKNAGKSVSICLCMRLLILIFPLYYNYYFSCVYVDWLNWKLSLSCTAWLVCLYLIPRTVIINSSAST